MSDENIVLVARLKVKEDAIEEAKKAALAIVRPSRDEAGCINYDFHQLLDDESVFIWHETWKDQKAIDAHAGSGHFKEFSKAVEDLTEEPLQLTFAKMVSEKA